MRGPAAASLALIALAWSPMARAQSKEELARADALFNAAKALTDAGDYADACAKFAESKRLAPGLGVTLYLADCYERIGRTASAWSEFRSAEGLARERNDKRAAVAHDRAQGLEPKLDRLTISVAPTIARAGLQILRDGVAVSAEELGLPVPVDPGDHAVVVTGPGHPARTFTAHVGPDHPSASVSVDSLDATSSKPPPSLPFPPPPSLTPPPAAATIPAPATPPEPPPPDATTGDSGSTRRWIGFGLGGAGVVGLGAGAVLGILAKSQVDQSNKPGGCDSTDHCTSQGLSDRKQAESLATGSTVAFIAGGVLLATGAVIYLTAPHGTNGAGVVVVPAPMAGGGGALLRASF